MMSKPLLVSNLLPLTSYLNKMNKIKSFLKPLKTKRFWKVTVLLSLWLLLVIIACNVQVSKETKNLLYTDIAEVPAHKVGLLLGTNPYLRSGAPNKYFLYRIDAAVALYKAGKIEYILVSGDNHRNDYNEPEAMKQALMNNGIPEERIVLDYAGFRTLDSVVRAKKVFGNDTFIVISQRFHNERAPGQAKSTEDSAIFALYRAFATPAETKAFAKAFASGIAWGDAKQQLFEQIGRAHV